MVNQEKDGGGNVPAKVETERSMTFSLYGEKEIKNFDKAVELEKAPGAKEGNRSALIRVAVADRVKGTLEGRG